MFRCLTSPAVVCLTFGECNERAPRTYELEGGDRGDML